jgi:hypothetical protein
VLIIDWKLNCPCDVVFHRCHQVEVYSDLSLRFISRVVKHRLVTISPLRRPEKVPSLRASGRQARNASRALNMI